MHYRLTEFSAPVRHPISFNEDYECISCIEGYKINSHEKAYIRSTRSADAVTEVNLWCPSRTILEGLF